MDVIIQYYGLILITVVALTGLGYMTYKYITTPSDKQKEQVKTILLTLVTYAEKEYGSKTGRLKFSYVYSELITKLPYLRYIPLSVIEALVNETLETMRHLLETNENVKNIVKGDV